MQKRNIIGVIALWAISLQSAFAAFHLVEITEIMTGADGDTSVQFIELQMLSDGEDFVDNLTIVARNADGSISNTVFTFPAGAEAQLVGQAGRHILIGTPAFADLAGITPDFTFAGGLFPGSGQVNYAFGTAVLSYGSYTGSGAFGGIAPAAPGDDLRSLQRVSSTGNNANDFVLAQNEPTNNANQNGQIAPAVKLKITEVDLATGSVEVTNFDTSSFTASSDLAFSHRGNSSTVIPSGTVFSSGESKLFTIAGLDGADSDLWLYRNTDVGNVASIFTGLKYGSQADVGDTGVAVAAGIWPSTTAFVPAPASGQTLRMIAHDTLEPGGWAGGNATPAAYFGTGTAIEDPLPSITTGSITIEVETIASGLTAPTGLADPNDGTGRLFVFEQTGEIRIIEGGAVLPTPFLDVSGRLVSLGIFGPGTFDERGLIGLALHPDFASNGKIYTYTSEPVSAPADFTVPLPPGSSFNNQGVIAEWTVDSGNPNSIDVTTRRELFRMDDPQFNHNGGTMHFGRDGMLYIAIGDAGAADDQDGQVQFGEQQFGHGPNGNGQNPETIFGNILRIDVDGNNSANGQYGNPADNPFVGRAGLDEVLAYGFRNPFSFSFDRLTGALYAGDVGQGDIEEVDIVTTGSNFGWRLKEGSFFFDPSTTTSSGFVTTLPVAPIPDDLVDPIAEYDHDDGVSVIGGYVYRGTTIPELEGKYVMGEFRLGSSGRLFYSDAAGGQILEFIIGNPDRQLGKFVKGFGEDANGELYVLASGNTAPAGDTGVVLRIIPGPGPSSVDMWMYYE